MTACQRCDGTAGPRVESYLSCSMPRGSRRRGAPAGQAAALTKRARQDRRIRLRGVVLCLKAVHNAGPLGAELDIAILVHPIAALRALGGSAIEFPVLPCVWWRSVRRARLIWLATTSLGERGEGGYEDQDSRRRRREAEVAAVARPGAASASRFSNCNVNSLNRIRRSGLREAVFAPSRPRRDDMAACVDDAPLPCVQGVMTPLLKGVAMDSVLRLKPVPE